MDLPIENKPIKYNTITVLDDDVNIYYVYNTLKQQIYSINKSIDKLKKRLDILIKGPQDVKAQQYDKVVSPSVKVENVKELFKEIEETTREIREKEAELETKQRYKAELEDTFRELLQLRPHNLELIVFYRRHVKEESLKKIHRSLRRFNAYGEKVRYNYSYIRYINTKIIKKMGKPNNSGLKSNTSL
jgi:DNA repair exonuclease SbcCD ATPase subunit